MIAIHKSDKGFATRWIDFCKRNEIPYKVVCCYDTDIVEQLSDCNALMWHHQQTDVKDVLTAKRILFALEHAGINVFPDFRTAWHFDDKVAQKYLLEALDIQHVKSYVFYEKGKALKFVQQEASFPIVFKLKGGAGSVNVKLIKSEEQAIRFIRKAFGVGFRNVDVWSMFKDKLRLARKNKTKQAWMLVLNAAYRLFIKNDYQKTVSRERGYIYFQEFIPKNTFDIRVIVIGDKAFGLKRYTRPNDFRASGSGILELSQEHFPADLIELSFKIKESIGATCVSIDFVVDYLLKKQLVTEISYGFPMKNFADLCRGYWNRSLEWVNDGNEKKLQDEMVIQMCKQSNIELPAHLK